MLSSPLETVLSFPSSSASESKSNEAWGLVWEDFGWQLAGCLRLERESSWGLHKGFPNVPERQQMCKYWNIDADRFVFHWGLHIRMKAKDWHKQKFTKVRFYVTIILPVKRKPKCDHSYMARFCHMRHYKHFQHKWLDSHTRHNFIITFVFMTTPMPVFFGEGQRPNYKQITRLF